jgi:hypothetical protein
VSLVRRYIRGCSDCEGGGCMEKTRHPQSMPVRFRDAIIGSVDGIRVKGLDVNGDGAVNGLENDRLGLVFGKEPVDSAYSSSYDYNADGRVDVSDVELFGAHCLHTCPSGGPIDRVSTTVLRFFVERAAEADSARERSVKLFLEPVRDVSSICFGLYNESENLAYDRWIPNPGFAGTTVVSKTVRNGRPIIFVAAYRMQSVDGASVEIGTLVYDVREESRPGLGTNERAIGEGDIVLAFSEMTNARGMTASFCRTEYEEEDPVCPNYLANCFPNPFNPVTTIAYSIKERGRVKLQVFDAAGRLVRTLVDEAQAPVSHGHTVQWRGENNAGMQVSSGVYFCRLATKGFTDTRKIVLLK